MPWRGRHGPRRARAFAGQPARYDAATPALALIAAGACTPITYAGEPAAGSMDGTAHALLHARFPFFAHHLDGGGRCHCRPAVPPRSEEHTSELQSQSNLVCRLLLEKKKKYNPKLDHYN